MKHKCRKINSQIFQNAAISLCKSFLPNYPLTSRVVGKGKGGGCFSSSAHLAWLSAKFKNQFLRTAGECGLGEMDKTRNGRGPLFFLYLPWANSAILIYLQMEGKEKEKKRFLKRLFVDCLLYAWICGKHIVLSFISVVRTVSSSFFSLLWFIPIQAGSPSLKVQQNCLPFICVWIFQAGRKPLF